MDVDSSQTDFQIFKKKRTLENLTGKKLKYIKTDKMEVDSNTVNKDNKVYTLITKDKISVKCSQNVAKLSVLIQNMMEDDDDDDNVIPLLNVNEKTLHKVLEFCEYNVSDPSFTEVERPIKSNKMDENVPTWYANYIDIKKNDGSVDQAANRERRQRPQRRPQVPQYRPERSSRAA